jgi:tetratricopeptide (TPR) repeat protein
VQDRSSCLAARASLERAEGRFREALADAETAIEAASTLGWGAQAAEQGIVGALDAALALGDSAKARELVSFLEEAPPGRRAPFLEAQAQRFRGRLDGDETAYRAAETILRERDLPFWLAVVQLEHAELLLERGRDDEAAPLLEGARETFERLEATPWLERVAKASPARREPEPVPGS